MMNTYSINTSVVGQVACPLHLLSLLHEPVPVEPDMILVSSEPGSAARFATCIKRFFLFCFVTVHGEKPERVRTPSIKSNRPINPETNGLDGSMETLML
jgi:hypothetical protein